MGALVGTSTLVRQIVADTGVAYANLNDPDVLALAWIAALTVAVYA